MKHNKLYIAALAACCCLAAGVSIWRLAAPRNSRGADSPGAAGSLDVTKLPPLPAAALTFTDASGALEPAASIALPSGSFTVELTQADVTGLFDPDAAPGSFPAALGWDDYHVSGAAIYDGYGQLWELSLWGELDDKTSFSLRASPGRIPPTCAADLGEQRTEVSGVPVSAWYQSYDRGGGALEHSCTTQFMAGDIGIRFTNTGSPLRSEYGGQSDMELGGAMKFNARFVTQALTGGLTLGELASNSSIPAWREAQFTTLEEARQEPEFAPYLPKHAPEEAEETHGWLHYQEDVRSELWVEWFKDGGNAYAEVAVTLPVGQAASPKAVNISIPESYDWRLYDGPIWEVVPEEYRDGFFLPVFRAGDMSPEIVEARGNSLGMEDGRLQFEFQVLYDSGAVASYTAAGFTAEEIWALVESTLN